MLQTLNKSTMNAIYPWQNQQWQQLLQRYQAGNLPHALLLSGVKGLGKRQLAENFAAFLLCQSPGACAGCQSCQWLAAATHPDLFYLQPAEDAKSIKIDDLRSLIESLNQTAQGGGFQVVIIDPAEALNRASANALLKSLEEPNGKVIFLLISHQSNAIPATVRSRCQLLSFPIPSASLSLSWLQEQMPEATNLSQILTMADNVPLRALHWIEQNQWAAQEKILNDFMSLFLENRDLLAVAQSYAAQEFNTVADCLWSLGRDLIVLQMDLAAQVKYSPWRENLIIISRQISSSRLFHFLDQLTAYRKWQEEKINLNMQLQWEEMLINLVQDKDI